MAVVAAPPIRLTACKLVTCSFSSEAIATLASENLATGCAVLSDGLACFFSVTTAGCSTEVNVTGGRYPSELPQFRWINTILGNLKTSLSGTLHAFNFGKVARRYPGGFCFRFNRRFAMPEMIDRIANSVCCCMPCTEHDSGSRRLMDDQVLFCL